MNIEHIKLSDELYLIAVTDKNDNVVAAGAFSHQEEAETAANIVHTVLAKQKSRQKTKPCKIEDLIKMMAAG